MNTREHHRRPIRDFALGALGLLLMAIVVHAAWRMVAPSISWLEAPAFGQSLTLTVALAFVGRMTRPRCESGPDERDPHRRLGGAS